MWRTWDSHSASGISKPAFTLHSTCRSPCPMVPRQALCLRRVSTSVWGVPASSSLKTELGRVTAQDCQRDEIELCKLGTQPRAWQQLGKDLSFPPCCVHLGRLSIVLAAGQLRGNISCVHRAGLGSQVWEADMGPHGPERQPEITSAQFGEHFSAGWPETSPVPGAKSTPTCGVSENRDEWAHQ